MFKKRSGEAEPSPRKMFFNNSVKTARVNIEHCFGILKGRWQFLRNASMLMKTSEDEARTHAMIQAAFILHNLTVKTWNQYLSKEEVQALYNDDDQYRRWSIEADNRYEGIHEDGHRREILVDELLEHLDSEIDPELLVLQI